VPRSLNKDVTAIDGVQVRWFAQNHPGGCQAYRFEQQDKSVVYATDNELDLDIIEDEKSPAQPGQMRQVPQSYLDFIHEADLLIADGQYTDAEYETKKGWGHPRATTVVDAAVAAGVKHLAIFHHDPMHADEDIDALIDACQQRARAHSSKLVVFGAREGVELRIDQGL
jgi:ribonuclease BN (tRNA processing enzyme)